MNNPFLDFTITPFDLLTLCNTLYTVNRTLSLPYVFYTENFGFAVGYVYGAVVARRQEPFSAEMSQTEPLGLAWPPGVIPLSPWRCTFRRTTLSTATAPQTQPALTEKP